VSGDKLEIRRFIGDLAAPLDHVYLTIKDRMSDADVDAILQKTITTTLDNNVGQIINAGDVNVTAEIVFVLLPAETVDLWKKLYHYDIKAFDTNGAPYRSELGVIYGKRPVTLAAS